MEDLHAAIATFLRSQRPAIVGATSPTRASALTPRRWFACRFCRRRVWESDHGEGFHFAELWETVSCAACHRARLADEAAAGGAWALLRQSWHRAARVIPRCKHCGKAIADGDDLYEVEQLRAVRECAVCHIPR